MKKKKMMKKKKKSFPDVSGDGKITKKDILMARGVIPKPKNGMKKKRKWVSKDLLPVRSSSMIAKFLWKICFLIEKMALRSL